MIFSKQKSLPKTIFGRAFYLDLFVHCFLHSHSNSNGHTDHGVVTGAQETHHLHVSGDGRGTGELRVGVHAAILFVTTCHIMYNNSR